MGCKVQGSGFRVQGGGFRVQGSGCRVQDLGCRVQGSGFRVQDSGCRVQGSGFPPSSQLGTQMTVPARRWPGLQGKVLERCQVVPSPLGSGGVGPRKALRGGISKVNA